MIRKRTIRLAPFALAALAALALASAAPARGTTTITISHQMRGCHVWSVSTGPQRPNLSVVIAPGSTLRFVNNDVMPHKLVRLSGPSLSLLKTANMNHAGASTSIRFTKTGVYKFTTKAGDDYMKGIKTVGEDNVLRLTVTVR